MHLISQDHQEWKTLNLDCGFWAEIKEYSNDLGLYARYSCDLYETRSLYYFEKKKNIRRPCRQKVRVDYLHFQLDQSCQWVFNCSHTHTCMYVINQFRGRTAIELLLLYLILMSVKIILSRWRR